MKSISLPSGEYLLVEVPEGETKFIIIDDRIIFEVDLRLGVKYNSYLPSGNWQIIGKASELSEDDWKWIVPLVTGGFFGHLTGYKRYENEQCMDEAPYKTATESGHSLITSHSMKPETTIILKKI